MKVMLTVYYDGQDEETTRVVYDPAWLQTNVFLQAATLGDAVEVVGAADQREQTDKAAVVAALVVRILRPFRWRK